MTARRAANTAALAAGFAIALYAWLAVAGIAPSPVHSYSGLNAGVTVGVGCHGLGFEYRGQVGFFTDLCQ